MALTNLYINDNNFTLNGTNYERDEYNGRCYQLNDSICLRSDCDGKLVKKRIKKADYNELLKKAKEATL